MSALRSLLASLGVALAVLGLLFVAFPGTAAVLSLSRLGVLFLGVLALIQAARSLRKRWRTAIEGAELPDPEERLETPRPGDEFDEHVSALSRQLGRGIYGSRYERVNRRLTEAAVEAAAHRWRLTTDVAERRVASGEWTDDPAAAWFLGDETVDPPPWPVRARAALAGRSAAGFYAARTADAVAELRGNA